MARRAKVGTTRKITNVPETTVLTCGYAVERVTGIEPALSAWEAVPSGPVTWPDLRCGVSVSDRERPLVTGVNGPAIPGGPTQSRTSFSASLGTTKDARKIGKSLFPVHRKATISSSAASKV